MPQTLKPFKQRASTWAGFVALCIAVMTTVVFLRGDTIWGIGFSAVLGYYIVRAVLHRRRGN